MSMRFQIEEGTRTAHGAARYCDEARGKVARLLEQAEGAGREATAEALREVLRLIVAAGIRAEQSAGAAINVGAFFGHEAEPEPLRFAADIARPGGLS